MLSDRSATSGSATPLESVTLAASEWRGRSYASGGM